MEQRTLELKVISAKHLRNVNYISRMDVYVVVSVTGDPHMKQRFETNVDRQGGTHPTWNFPIKFTVNDALLHQNRLNLVFKLRCDRFLGDRDIGEVNVPVKELLESTGDEKSMKFVSYQVRKPSGKGKGELNFSYKFGDEKQQQIDIAYPVVGSSSGPYYGGGPGPGPYQPFGYGYPPSTAAAPYPAYHQQAAPPPQGGYGYPPPPPPGGSYGCPPQAGGYGYPPSPQGGYGYPPPPPPGGSYGCPPQAGGYGYPPSPQGGYGYPPPQSGYGYPPPPPPGGSYGCPPQAGGYGYPPPPVQQPAKKNKFGIGLGAGLLGGALGGLLIGDMISDSSAYDAGFYDAGGF